MNVKKIIFSLFLFVYAFSIGQVKPKAAVEVPKSSYIVFKQAKDYDDGATMINALHQIIAAEGSSSSYRDTLAFTYYKMNNPLSCHLVVKEILEKKSKNLMLLELNAMSLQQLNAKKEAISAYEKLFGVSKNKFHGYQLASLQQSIKRFAEAQATLIQVNSCNDIKGLQLEFPKDKNQNQKIVLNAAIENLKGLIAYELKDINGAINAFGDAIKICPDFELAKQNYNLLILELEKMGAK